MNILIIGSGGREHAIAWKLAQSPKLSKLYVMPGNPGTAQLAENVSIISVDDHAEVVRCCREKQVDLVIIGPEAPLANGLGDYLHTAGLRVFGPNRNAAEIESSKVFAKEFMARHHIPTARFATFVDFDAAIAHVKSIDYPVVIKASGLAAGKGVLLPDTLAEAEAVLRQIMVAKEFGAAGAAVVIEERMSGPEVSLLAFTRVPIQAGWARMLRYQSVRLPWWMKSCAPSCNLPSTACVSKDDRLSDCCMAG
jgi:phosphoribosylamine--glycine ligase